MFHPWPNDDSLTVSFHGPAVVIRDVYRRRNESELDLLAWLGGAHD